MQWFMPYVYVPSMDAGTIDLVTPFGSVTIPLFVHQFYGVLVALALVLLTALWHVCGGRYVPEEEVPYTKKRPAKKKSGTKAATEEDSPTEAKSALEENIVRNGENSYYYAHKVRDVDDAPIQLKQTISQYGWSDGRKTVTIYVDHADALTIEKDAVTIQWSSTSLSLDITFPDADVRSLVIPKLYGAIDNVAYKSKKDSLVFTLTKKHPEPWKSLNAAAKNLDAHIEYDESLYD
ncbi:hypothetical protein ACHHYP_00273 [Achlya hypogyna]|uniref:CS domain-containing protein n=1 Tax=Achlya hypogyna TaxID=1202772 RepID=A0A1V9ZVE5_ACHHY|nr:hypothetical protein ACHHYP_00273 [Achlya hypogyna]